MQASVSAVASWSPRVLRPALALVTFLLASVLAGGASAQAAPPPEEAIRQSVEARGEVYAGDCAATVSPRDIDKVCSRFVEERGAQRAYLLGRTFSEFSHWSFVELRDGRWQVFAEAPLDFSSTSVDVPWP